MVAGGEFRVKRQRGLSKEGEEIEAGWLQSNGLCKEYQREQVCPVVGWYRARL